MTLEEYRVQVLEKLKGCRDPAQARSLLAEVDLVITNSQVSNHTQKVFWATLIHELDVVEQEASARLGRIAAAELGVAIAAARTAIFEYEVLVRCDELGTS